MVMQITTRFQPLRKDMGKVKKSYFLSFVTAFVYGMILDLAIDIVALLPFEGTTIRVLLFAIGLTICTAGVALLFHTYFPPEAYEMFVKEVSQKYSLPIGRAKTVYDFCSCIIAVILSLCFFGSFVGVTWGTIICTILNGWLIGRFSRLLEEKFDFKDALPLRDKIQ